MRKFLFLLCCIAFSLFAGPKAQWIVYPEDVKEGVNKERYLRTEFKVPRKKIKQAMSVSQGVCNSTPRLKSKIWDYL